MSTEQPSGTEKHSGPFVPAAFAGSTAASLVKLLDRKLARTPDDPKLWLRRADLARRAGLVRETRKSYRQLLNLTEKTGSMADSDKLTVPPGVKDEGGFEAAPVYVIDDFVPASLVTDLLEHVENNQTSFKKARVNHAKPELNDSARRTEIFHKYTIGRDYFLSTLRAMQPELCHLFDMPEFEIGRMETKISNHISGGHFHPHNDDNARSGPGRRRLSWLFYFHRQPRNFSGGDLFLFDTRHAGPDEKSTFKPERYTRIEPANNRLVVFRSADFHAVTQTVLPTGQFMDGRMAVAGHIRCI